ncbi:MAG: hypothetical protein EPN26_00770 [Rhodospirillales bacterium]|nr:MAG: hypothetical protein EPN26_00770 [Rhodospirillales bacterium]
MYTLLRTLSTRQLLLNQAPSLIGSLVIAELFYKFHSFLLETGAFLATWFVLDIVTGLLLKSLLKAKPDTKNG